MVQDLTSEADQAAPERVGSPEHIDVGVQTHQSRVKPPTVWENAEVDLFDIAGLKWRAKVAFPNGRFGVYLEAVAATPSEKGLYRDTHFTIRIVNHKDPARCHTGSDDHRFETGGDDRGFPFGKPEEIFQAESGFLSPEDGTLLIEFDIHVRGVSNKPAGHAIYNSRKATGYVGLKNKGATCYMNSLLQELFFLGKFRRAVYQMPVDDDIARSVPYALQNVFYRLQFHDRDVGTKRLLRSFGWETMDAFVQHDVQELNRVLCDNLEQKMKGTPVDGTIGRLFVGKVKNFIKCINIQFESSRVEDFYDLSLPVKGMPNLYASLDKYVEEEVLDGDNQYHADGHGLQDAKKGIRFLSFPPVLIVQLMRWHYDFNTETNVKLNDFFEFPVRLELEKYLAEGVKPPAPYTYYLHGVLVHQGDSSHGHYYAFIQPHLDGKWLKFDDQIVTPVSSSQAVKDNYGGPTDAGSQKSDSAYMLVYIQESHRADILCPVTKEDIPTALQTRIEEEMQEKNHKKMAREREKMRVHLEIHTMETCQAFQQGQCGEFDFLGSPILLSAERKRCLGDYHDEVELHTGIPAKAQRFWMVTRRVNFTTRLAKPFTPADMQKPVEEVRSGIFVERVGQFHFITEFDEAQADPVVLPSRLIFLKFFNYVSREVKLLDGLYVFPTTTFQEVLSFAQRLYQLPPDDDYLLFEEVQTIQKVMVTPLTALHMTMKGGDIDNGDILILQKKPSEDEIACSRCCLAPGYYEWVKDDVNIAFRDFETNRIAFDMTLKSQTTLEQVCVEVGKQLDVDPRHLLLYGHDKYNDVPLTKPYPPGSRLCDHKIASRLVGIENPNYTLYFKNVGCDTAILDTHDVVHVAHNAHKRSQYRELRLVIPRGSDLRAMVEEEARKRLGIPEEMQVFTYMVTKNNEVTELNSADIRPTSHKSPVYLQIFGEDELQAAAITPFSYQSRAVTDLVPFLFPVCQGLTVDVLRRQLAEFLDLPKDETSKWDFRLAAEHKPLKPDVDVFALQAHTSGGLVIIKPEHMTSSPKKLRRGEKSIRIYN